MAERMKGMRKFPLVFFLLVFLISVPFWLIGPFIEHFLPKDRLINLPVSALMAFNPMIVALTLVFRRSGTEGVKGLLKRAFDHQRIEKKAWYLPVFLLMPFIMALQYGLIKLMGHSIPVPQFPIVIVPIFFCVFFITAAGEEVGWQGYAFEPLYERWNALQTGLILGTVWAVWHIVPLAQAHRTPTWIVWQCIATVGLRVLVVWLYNNTGNSLFAAITFHTMINVSTFLFPNYGSHYDPFIASIIIMAAASMVIAVWGAKTLARYRYL